MGLRKLIPIAAYRSMYQATTSLGAKMIIEMRKKLCLSILAIFLLYAYASHIVKETIPYQWTTNLVPDPLGHHLPVAARAVNHFQD